MKKKIFIAFVMLLLVIGGFLYFIKSNTEVVFEIESGGTVTVDKIIFSTNETQAFNFIDE